ncbi:MAG: UMP kinase [Spirochaetaceae bacterium]|jgi:uridylate kinase|nr:UMP kinase [Spirochaetaceae bacterium]
MTSVISLGGSLIVPEQIGTTFIKEFIALIEALLAADESRKFIIVTGGGSTARRYQEAFFEIDGVRPEAAGQKKAELNDCADWIGIAATRLNAELIRQILRKHCSENVVYDPSEAFDFEGRVLVAAGWKPGFSSDNDAVILARKFGADTVINLSNIEKIYTGDPKRDPSAKPLDSISWREFRAMVGDAWVPGANLPFDPIASKLASESGIKVIFAAGHPIKNLENILLNKAFTGTTIGK